jgi:cobalt-zinc-cadmium efflux system outer membrane protein
VNPAIELGGGRRRAAGGTIDYDRSVELSQQIEIGGQRGSRIDAAEAELRGATAAAAAAERLVTAEVLSGVAQVVRSRQVVELVRDQREAASRLAEVGRARAEKGVAAPLESELTEAARIQALRDERTAAQELLEAEARLATAVGYDVQLESDAPLPAGAVMPKALADLEQEAILTRPEVVSARNDVEAARARVDLLRRERIPDVTIAGGYRHEEFSDVVGLRLAIPIPLFRRNQGEIAEQQARTSQAALAARQAELRVRLAVRAAYRSWERAKAAADAVPSDLDARLRRDVRALQQAYQRGTLPLTVVLTSLRETQAARRTTLDARMDAVMASIDLARTAGLSPCPPGGCR